jgi:coenzyme F420-reducing hydrogenase alpha subunit
MLDSHLLHIYILVLPDLLGVKSFVPLIDSHNKVVRRALRMKKAFNDVCEVLTGRHIHPISSIVGGFTKIPTPANVDKMLNILYEMRADMDATVQVCKTLEFPSFERETEYVALVSDDEEYPLLEGNVGSSDGMVLPKAEYKNVTNEFIVPHSSAKHAKWNRESYMVGALARFNLNAEKLHPKAKNLAGELGMKGKVCNPFLNTAAQLIESVHCLEDSITILEKFKKDGLDESEAITVGLNENNNIKVKAGNGVAAVEVPRGILFHNYEVDDKGKIINANCIIPTSQNINSIEQDMKSYVPKIVKNTDEEIELLLEMLVRAYDPCISCSAHFLDIKFVNR